MKKKMMFLSLSLIRVSLIGLICIGLYGICYVLVPLVGNGVLDRPNHGFIKVYIVKSGVHTDFVLPISESTIDWKSVFIQNESSDSLPYMAIGWGHKAFYMETPTWDDLTLENALSATFGRGGTAVHVRNIPKPTIDVNTRAILLDSAQYRNLCNYIKLSIQLEKGAARPIEELAQPHDRYYDAIGRYHALRTCNTWIADGLLAACVSGPMWTASTKGLFLE